MYGGHTGPFSYSPGGFPHEDIAQQRRLRETAHQQDDFRGSPLRQTMTRPNAKSIYMQRKEYSETLNKQSNSFHSRVEHLFTCELDGQDMKTVNDCVAKLKRLDAKGRLWPQDMILEVQRGYLVLSDIETKAELEALPFNGIQQITAVLDSCAYNSLLAVTVQDRNKHSPQVFLFQCEETGAELIKSDLDKAVQKGDDDVDPRRDQFNIRTNLENIIGQHTRESFRQAGPPPRQRDRAPPLPDHPPPQWRDPAEHMPPPMTYAPEPMMQHPDFHDVHSRPEPPSPAEPPDTERNTEIFNHVLNDIEFFVNKVSAAANAPLQEQDHSKKKKKSKKSKSKTNEAPVINLPPWEEYVSFLQKVKYGFNLLGKLDGALNGPTAPDFVHMLFSSLATVVPQYPPDIPPSVVSPLLIVPALRLLSQVVDPEEDNLWRFLGDSWNVPRSKWPEDVPPYIPEFYDGWQPPPPSPMRARASPMPQQNGGLSRGNSQRFPPGQHPEQIPTPMTNGPWGSPPPMPPHPTEPPLYMRVIYNFMAKNNQELSVMKGDVVQVVQKAKQWWFVRNSSNEEGNVPQSVLEPMEDDRPMDDQSMNTDGPVMLDLNSSAAEVRAWLEYKGFSRITVSSLGVLTGRLLLGMSKNDIRTVCPEEGGKVFFQLQAIKSSIALASEPSGMYNGRY